MNIMRKLGNNKTVYCKQTESGLLGGFCEKKNKNTPATLNPFFAVEQAEDGRTVILVNDYVAKNMGVEVRICTDQEFSDTPAIPCPTGYYGL